MEKYEENFLLDDLNKNVVKIKVFKIIINVNMLPRFSSLERLKWTCSLNNWCNSHLPQ